MKVLPTYPNPELYRRHFAPGVPPPAAWYRCWRKLFQLTFPALWKLRVFNRHYEPTSGSALYICNHQSFLDPPLMSLSLIRPMNYMARDSLFHNALFGPLIRSFNAFPVKRGQADTGALREALRRLKAGGQLVIFPEGTRTTDGRVGEFLPGVSMLAQRAADWVIPTAIDGAYECWPKSHPLPLPGRIYVMYDKPLSHDEIKDIPGPELVAMIRGRIIAMQAELRQRLDRPPIRY